MGRIKRVIQIDKDKCVECGECKKTCSKINYPKLCSGCGKCVAACQFDAITLVEQTKNENTTNWFWLWGLVY
jgi:Predicted ATPase, RNase L inhibitor (RLI) homolog